MSLREKGVKVRIKFNWLRIWSSGYFCGHGNEASGSINAAEYLSTVQRNHCRRCGYEVPGII
jgi:hypothetical protein